MDTFHEFFSLNRPLVLFVYGQTFFVMGLAIFLQSRRHSRLQLARDLRWLAAFGILHGFHEWADIFIPIQASYLPQVYVVLLSLFQRLLLAASFACLLGFGVVTLRERWPWLRSAAFGLVALWCFIFWIVLYSVPDFTRLYGLLGIWARYLLGLPGSLLAAYGLRYQAQTKVKPLGAVSIYNTLRLAGWTLVFYAIAGGIITAPGKFFPASVLNWVVFQQTFVIPVEVFRSLAGLLLAVFMIRALEIFELEVDRIIEGMQVERIRLAERDRIGQEIHDGAIQAIYSASLVLESAERATDPQEAALRLSRTRRILESAVTDLRRYMISLRTDAPAETLEEGLQRLANDPRFGTLLEIRLKLDSLPPLTALQVGHILAIVQECLSNSARHAGAGTVTVSLRKAAEGCCVISIRDDGHGFDLDTASRGFGLSAMEDRARLLGGQLKIDSAPGKHTTITLSLPQDASL